MFRVNYKESISSTSELLGSSRQVYYRGIRSKQKRQPIAGQVTALVQQVRIEQPRIGTKKITSYTKELITRVECW